MEDLNLREADPIDALEKTENFTPVTSQMEQFTQPPDSFEVESTKRSGKCNLRKSLAWDAAFFTSAGVLDPDELSSMIGGGSSSKAQFLPGIEEDIYRSTDSLSTLASENLSLESLEVDLFQDIRASIQRSSKASNREKPINIVSGDAGAKPIFSLEKDLVSKNVAQSSVSLKKQNNRLPTPGKLNVQSSNKPQSTSKRPVAGAGAQTPSIQKSIKASGRPTSGPSAAAERSTLRGNQTQPENSKAKALGKVAAVPKVPGFGASNRIVPKPVLPSKPTSSSSSTATKRETSKLSSSSDSSTSNVSASSSRRKIAVRYVKPTASSSTPKTPSRVAIKKKGENGLSASLRSSTLSSNISPASSISEWSVASSSSTSSVNQSSNSMAVSTGARTSDKSRDNYAPLKSTRRSTNEGLDKPENKASRTNSEKPNGDSAQRGPPPKPATAKPSGPHTTGPPPKLEMAKPSGLRMPSPKIGFFDGVKTAGHTPGGSSQSRSGIPTGRPKVGPAVSTPTGVASKAKSPQLQPTRLTKPVGNIKLDTQKSASPLSAKRTSNASTKVPSSPKNAVTPLHSLSVTHNQSNEENSSKAKGKGVREHCETNDGETGKITLVGADGKLSGNVVNLLIASESESVDDCKGKLASEEDSNDLISEKISSAALMINVDLDKQMNDDVMNLKTVLNGDIYEHGEKLTFEEKGENVKATTERLRPADMKSEMNMVEKSNSYSLNENIDPVGGSNYDCEEKMSSEERNSNVCVPCYTSPDGVNLEVKIRTNPRDIEIVPMDDNTYKSEGKWPFEEKKNGDKSSAEEICLDDNTYDSEVKFPFEEKKNDDKSSTEEISLAVLESNVNLEVKISAESRDMEIVVPVNEEIYDGERKMESADKSNEAININENSTPADLGSDMNLGMRMSANSVYDNIVPVDGDIRGNMVCEEKLDGVEQTDNNIGCDHATDQTNSHLRSCAMVLDVNIDPVNEEIYDCEGEIVTEEKNNGVRSIPEEFCPTDRKGGMNLEENANSVFITVYPVDKEINGCQGNPAPGENREVILVTKQISPADLNSCRNFEDMEIVPVDGNDSVRKIPSIEKSSDVKSSTENFILSDPKVSANSGDVEIVDGIKDCQEKMESEEKNNDARSTNENISADDLGSDVTLDVNLSAEITNDTIVPVDGNNGGNVVREEKVDNVKLDLEKLDCRQVICGINLEKKTTANLVDVNVAAMNGDKHESEITVEEKGSEKKSEIRRLINNWNSLHQSAEKENQVKGLILEVRLGHLEHDQQKENASKFISSPRNSGQTDEMLSNLSQISKTSETTTSSRTPFTDKNSPCHDDIDVLSTELSAFVMECSQAENR